MPRKAAAYNPRRDILSVLNNTVKKADLRVQFSC